MTADFVVLHKEAEAEGLFKPVYWRNFMVVLEVTFTMALGAWIVSNNDTILYKCLGAVIVGLGMGRMGLLQHECGHNSVSGNPKMDKMLQNIFYGLLKNHKKIIQICFIWEIFIKDSTWECLPSGGCVDTTVIMQCRFNI
jgi:hypothetical protein